MSYRPDNRALPDGQGASKNLYLRWKGNGINPTSYTIERKGLRPSPRNWPMIVTRDINAQCYLRHVDGLTPIIDVEAHLPTSLQLVGRHQVAVHGTDAQRRIAGRTRSALLLGVNYFDRWLQASLGSAGRLETTVYYRGSSMYIKTNLSSSLSAHALAPPLLDGIPGIVPAHFDIYTYSRHLLGVKVNCGLDTGVVCRCMTMAELVLPAMWLTR